MHRGGRRGRPSEGFEDGADDGLGEILGDPFHGVRALSEERRDALDVAATPRCDLVFVTEGQLGVFPQHVIGGQVGEFDPCRQREDVARGLLLVGEAGRGDVDIPDLADEQDGVDPRRLRAPRDMTRGR